MERADLDALHTQDSTLWFPGSLYVIKLLHCRVGSGYDSSRVCARLAFQQCLGFGRMNELGNRRHLSLCETEGTSVEAYYDERMRECGLPVISTSGSVHPPS